MTNIDKVIAQDKSNLEKGYVFVHVKEDWLRTLVSAYEEAQKENATMKEALIRIVNGQYGPFENYGTVAADAILSTLKREKKYTCGECYTTFDLPADNCCPTCKIREVVPCTP
jgi:rubrerythrin